MNLALGTPVVYTQCAAVARKGKADMWNRGWFLPEKNNGEVPSYPNFDGGESEEAFGFEPTNVTFVKSDGEPLNQPTIDKISKAVVTWRQLGSGVVCGLETKQYGISHAPGGGTNRHGEDDWEPGYFDNYGRVKLYVVRSRLEGRAFVYVPPWAIQPMVPEAA
jgi:hypothetical protein